VGYRAGANVTTADNVICIGASVWGANVSNRTWIDNVYGVTTQSGFTVPVVTISSAAAADQPTMVAPASGCTAKQPCERDPNRLPGSAIIYASQYSDIRRAGGCPDC
jgi:hypothetical protein